MTWFGVPLTQFTLASGEDFLVWYRSSPEAQRGFCRQCGSSLFFQSTRWADEIHITLVNLDGEIDLLPQAHVYFDTHVSWVNLSDQLSRLGGETGVEPLDSAT